MLKYLTIILLGLSICATASSPSYRPNIKFASGINPNDINKIDPRLLKVVFFIAEYCENNEVTFVVTSMIRSTQRNIEVKSKSLTHVEGRAVDFSVKEQWGWNEAKLAILMEEVQMKYSFIGAWSYMGRQRTILLMHSVDGSAQNFHAHVQVDRPRK